ncbi:MAG: hypothetical protein QM628_11715 [Propionicimonas sp.]
MKKLLSLLAATGLLAGSLFATAVPAQAEESDTTITLTGGIVVKDLVISSRACKPITISLPFQANPADAMFDEVHAHVVVGNDKMWYEEYPGAVEGGRVMTNTGAEFGPPMQWCAAKNNYQNLSGLGAFLVALDYVAWWNAGSTEEQPSGSFDDQEVTATFTVKQASRVSSAKISKKGTKRTISATFSYFDVTKKAKKEWTALPKGTKVELQRSTPGAQSWTKVKTVKVGSKGTVKTTYKTTKKYDYRFVYAGNATKAPVTSKTLKK